MTKINCQREFEKWNKTHSILARLYDYSIDSNGVYVNEDIRNDYKFFKAGFEAASGSNTGGVGGAAGNGGNGGVSYGFANSDGRAMAYCAVVKRGEDEAK